MKDRILNFLMLATVCCALLFSFFHEKGQDSSAVPTFLVTAAPSLSPAPQSVRSYLDQRAQQRQQEMAALKAIMENEHMDESLRTAAGMELMGIAKNTETELALEAAIAARGLEGICVFRKGKITLFLSPAPDAATASLLTHLAAEITGLALENIRLSPC